MPSTLISTPQATRISAPPGRFSCNTRWRFVLLFQHVSFLIRLSLVRRRGALMAGPNVTPRLRRPWILTSQSPITDSERKGVIISNLRRSKLDTASGPLEINLVALKRPFQRPRAQIPPPRGCATRPGDQGAANPASDITIDSEQRFPRACSPRRTTCARTSF